MKIGKYEIYDDEMEDGKIWIEKDQGEAMRCDIALLESAIDDFFAAKF